jgi:hypothetical protein
MTELLAFAAKQAMHFLYMDYIPWFSTTARFGSQELLSPAELRFATELNHMDIPLHVTVDDPLEPPLSTSR